MIQLSFQEKEILTLIIKHRLLAIVDPVSVHNDIALLSLPEYLSEPCGVYPLAGDHVAQDVARSDRRQLVIIADQEQSRSRTDGTHQSVHQQQVDHGRLIHNDRAQISAALALRPAGYLLKPVNQNKLLMTILDALNGGA